MVTVTPAASAIGLMRLRPTTQLSRPSWSGMPLRFPKNVIRFGTPICAALGKVFSNPLTMASWLALLLSPSGIVPPPP